MNRQENEETCINNVELKMQEYFPEDILKTINNIAKSNKKLDSERKNTLAVNLQDKIEEEILRNGTEYTKLQAKNVEYRYNLLRDVAKNEKEVSYLNNIFDSTLKKYLEIYKKNNEYEQYQKELELQLIVGQQENTKKRANIFITSIYIVFRFLKLVFCCVFIVAFFILAVIFGVAKKS